MPTFARFFKWLFSARIQIRIWCCVVVLGVTIVVAWNWFDVSGHKRWLAWKAEWEAKGESFAPESVIPLPVPDEQNAAKSELFTPLFKNAEQNSPAFKKASERFTLATKRSPSHEKWQLGKLRDLAKWEAAILGVEDPPEKGATPADTLLNALKPFEADLDLLATAMEQPHSRFDIRYEDVFMALMPHLSFLKQAARLYSLRASAHLAKGDSEKAMADVLRGIRVSELIRSEPMLISQLVRNAILQQSLVPFCDGLHQKKWTDAQLAEFQKKLQPVDLLEGTELAFRGERNLVNLWFDQIVEGTAKSTGVEDFNPGWFLSLNRYHLNRIITENVLASIDVEQHSVRMEGVPTTEDESRKLSEAPFAFRHAVALMVIPAYDKMLLRMTATQAGLEQMIIAAGLERHRLAKGGYPKALAELVPAHLAKVPGDLFHDRGLVYRQVDDSFTLYSTGYNVRDDGGEYSLVEGKNVGIKWEEGDWPWPSAVTK